MTLKGFSIIVLVLVSLQSFGQFRLSGTVLSGEDSASVGNCIVYLNNGKQSAVTDHRGKFVFGDVPNGDHTLHFTSPEFEYIQLTVNVSNEDRSVRAYLEPRSETLAEVMITDAQSSFGFTRMRSVESTGIYEGKKSEVVIPEQLTANLSTNNARQVYARVAGLNIWENDD